VPGQPTGPSGNRLAYWGKWRKSEMDLSCGLSRILGIGHRTSRGLIPRFPINVPVAIHEDRTNFLGRIGHLHQGQIGGIYFGLGQEALAYPVDQAPPVS